MDLLGCITRKLKRWFCPQARLNPRAHVALAGFPSSFGSWVLSSFSGKHFPQSDKNGPWQPLVHSWYTNYSPRKQELERCCILTPIGTLSCVNCRVIRVASMVVQNQILHSLAKYWLKIKKESCLVRTHHLLVLRVFSLWTEGQFLLYMECSSSFNTESSVHPEKSWCSKSIWHGLSALFLLVKAVIWWERIPQGEFLRQKLKRGHLFIFGFFVLCQPLSFNCWSPFCVLRATL